MDHLPYPENSAYPPLEIPFICEDLLRAQNGNAPGAITLKVSFLDFLYAKLNQDRNDDSEEDESGKNLGHWDDCDADTAAERAQAFIYFGLLLDCIGPNIRLEHFVRESATSGQRIVTLQSLSSVYQDIVNVELDGWRSIEDALVVVIESQLLQSSHLGGLIATSIESLVWTLQLKRLPVKPALSGSFSRPGDILEQRMLKAGWCPHWTRVYAELGLSAALRHYLAAIPSTSQSTHKKCSILRCMAGQVNQDYYETKHANVSCHCSFMGPDVKEIERIVRKGGIPLIRLFKEGNDSRLKLETLEYHPGVPFVAISHVWVGGLGNFKANSLPRCQLDCLLESTLLCESRSPSEIFSSVFDNDDRADNRFRIFEDLLTLLGRRIRPAENASQIIYRRNIDIGLTSAIFRPYLVLNELNRRLPFLSAVASRHAADMEAFVQEKFLGWLIPSQSIKQQYIWIDTLCIPADPTIQDLKDLKQQAIDKMAFVYSLAKVVLVLDPALQDLQYGDIGTIAADTQILTCSWMSRCWTFQEGCLGHELCFRLKDRVLNIRNRKFSSSDNHEYKISNSLEIAIREEIFFWIEKEMPDVNVKGTYSSSPKHFSSLFTTVWNQLAIRETSQPDDLHKILAVMLGLSAHEICTRNNAGHFPEGDMGKGARDARCDKTRKHKKLTLPKHESMQRMKAVLRGQQELPLSMFYIPHPETIALDKNDPWIPPFPSGTITNELSPMEWLEDGSGLKIRYLGVGARAFLLDKANFQGETKFCLQTNIRKCPLIFVTIHPTHNFTDSRTWEEKPLCFFIDDLHTYRHLQSRSPEKVGALFAVTESMDSTSLSLSFICPVTALLISHRCKNSIPLESVPHFSVRNAMSNRFRNARWVVRCDSKSWYNPAYRRPDATTVQPSVSFLVFAILLWIWVTQYYLWHYDFNRGWSRKELPDITGSAPLDENNQFSYIWHSIFQNKIFAKIIKLTFGPTALLISRIAFFLLLEFPRLELIAQRIRDDRLVRSVDFIPMAGLAVRQPHRLWQEFSLQYKPLWLSLLPLLGSVLLMYYPQCLFLYRLETSWTKDLSVSLNRFGLVLALETLGRILLELLGTL